MDDYEVEISEEVGRFAETYSSFNKIINKLQRQYLTLKETHSQQSEELQSVNRTLQSLVGENRAVTEFLNSILYSISSGVIAIDKAGKITHMNQAAQKMLGISPDAYESGKMQYEEILKSIEKTKVSAVETIRTGQMFDNAEKRVKSHHGAILALSISTSLLKNHSGETVGAVELFHDISKIKRMEEQLSRMKILASLGEMAASIAHEVRNPLGGISGFAALLARDLKDDPAKKEMAEKIVIGVNSINQIIETLLDFARHEVAHKVGVNLNDYMNNLLDNFSDQYNLKETGGSIIREFVSDRKIAIELDPQLFKQAIFNLIKNGLEAGRPDCSVTVRWRELSLPETQQDFGHKLELSALEAVAKIEIEDNGAGIPERDLGKIFSPFYSTKQKGTGLGLSIAWKIVKAHGGDIKAESEVGHGTKFSIVLPMKAGG